MLHKILADIVVLVHFLWIVFLFLGGLWGRRWIAIKVFHLAGLFFALFIQALDWYCPLTHIEVWLRARHDPFLGYTGSFIIHYIEQIVYIEISRYWIVTVTLLLCGFNAWLYLVKKKR